MRALLKRFLRFLRFGRRESGSLPCSESSSATDYAELPNTPASPSCEPMASSADPLPRWCQPQSERARYLLDACPMRGAIAFEGGIRWKRLMELQQLIADNLDRQPIGAFPYAVAWELTMLIAPDKP